MILEEVWLDDLLLMDCADHTHPLRVNRRENQARVPSPALAARASHPMMAPSTTPAIGGLA